MKRLFDIVASLVGLIIFIPVLIICWLIVVIETKENGIFRQVRIGRYAKPFKVLKLKTMRNSIALNTSVTTAHDPRITKSGKILRKFKIDELPQLFNVLLGEMSLVGPRPDVPGYADKLVGDDRIILSVRPGITGPAQLYFKDEEELLAKVEDPEKYNREVIWPKKVELNREYANANNLFLDIRYVLCTII